jgi:hypothetical protein
MVVPNRPIAARIRRETGQEIIFSLPALPHLFWWQHGVRGVSLAFTGIWKSSRRWRPVLFF